MQFTRVMGPVEDMEVWNASGNDFSFVISHESDSGSGFRGKPGFTASWRSMHRNSSATEVGGSPFETFTDAESACKAMASLLTEAGPSSGRVTQISFDVPAVLRKWPSLRNERRLQSPPYFLAAGTLEECLRALMAKPAPARHLYEIRVVPADAELSAVLPLGLVTELARVRNIE